MSLRVVVEGDTDLPFVRKLANYAGFDVDVEIDANGKDALDEAFPGYNGAARGSPWLVIRDLDHDAPCAAALLTVQGVAPARWMVYRIAVREIEAWAMADAAGTSSFFGVKQSRVPDDPDDEDHPTRALVDLCGVHESDVFEMQCCPLQVIPFALARSTKLLLSSSAPCTGTYAERSREAKVFGALFAD